MNNKKIPLRKCVSTGEILPKKELLRIVRTPEGNVLVDLTSKLNGHGAYLKRSIEALNKAKKSNCLKKALECEIPESLYLDIQKVIEEN